MKRMLGWFALALLAGGVAMAGWLFALDRDARATWQAQVVPGQLSTAHSFLEDDCGACHTPVKGADDFKCVGCHAAEDALLQQQSTAFHASTRGCGRCHFEHRGIDATLRRMDHDSFARIALAEVEKSPSGADQAERTELLRWVDRHEWPARRAVDHAPMSARSLALNCHACHGTKDRHQGVFGTECSSCHTTTQWFVAQFQHPSMNSIACSQCHLAPPSHYMMHFAMVSVPVAAAGSGEVSGCCGPVTVEQCYRCHQPTSWNDIKGVGWYKHH
ncbi:MAG: cytochrome C [Pseudomonadales bacterium]